MGDKDPSERLVGNWNAHRICSHERQGRGNRSQTAQRGHALIDCNSISRKFSGELSARSDPKLEEAHRRELSETERYLVEFRVDGVQVGLNTKVPEVAEHVLGSGLALSDASVVVRPHRNATIRDWSIHRLNFTRPSTSTPAGCASVVD
jgi:hypothetical protein